MCSIVGYVGDVNKSMVNTMLKATRHRGTDDRGVYINKNVGIGQNRLSVIDLSKRGKQPMFDDEKSVCIVFNGEIYNFQDLRKKLEGKYKFNSNSDTETILYAYKEWGTKCLEKLNGMFAFVIYDLENNLLFGARDRLGEKPLKYYFKDGVFAFSSEVKGLLSVINNKPELDHSAIDDYLTLSYVPSPKTGFKDIYKLSPGHFFVYKNGKLNIKKYWKLNHSVKKDLSENEWMDLLEKSIESAVKDRLVSDVPLGALLSGGVDSSAVVAFMARNSKKRIKTFSIGFSDSKYDETNYAKMVAKKYNTSHTVLKVNPKDFLDMFDDLSKHYDEPFADNSAIPSLILSKMVRKKVTVALGGDGGDENFAGYERYNVVALGDMYSVVPKPIRNFIKIFARALLKFFPSTQTKRLDVFLNTFELPFYKKYLYYRSFFDNEKKKIYSKEFKKKIKGNNTFEIYKYSFNKKITNLDNALKFDIESYLPEDLMFKIDIASMSQALEIRAPFLDYKLMELTAQMPSILKIKFYNKKYLFKKMLLKKNILPREIVNRRKRGFVAPIARWLKADLKEYVHERLTSKKFRDMNIFDDEKLDNYIKNYNSSKIDTSNNMFALLALASWVEEYF